MTNEDVYLNYRFNQKCIFATCDEISENKSKLRKIELMTSDSVQIPLALRRRLFKVWKMILVSMEVFKLKV